MKKNNVELLLSKLDKSQLADFIRKECSISGSFQDRFLALGAGILFKPNPEDYAARVKKLIINYGGKYGYIEYGDTSSFNSAVSLILNEADEALEKGQWEVAVAVLTGIASVAEDILNSGDDSNGDLGAIVDDCFEKMLYICEDENLPENIRNELFGLAISRFNDKDLKGWDWWWNWIGMAIELADSPEKQSEVIKSLDAIQTDDSDWHSRYDANTAQEYKLEMMSRCGSEEDQVKFMYDNLSNPDFRHRLIQMAWDKSDYDEVLRLAKDGMEKDAEYAGLVDKWRKWLYRVYHKTGNKDAELNEARYFFFQGRAFGEKEFDIESMYSAFKSIIPQSEWPGYVKSLVKEAKDKDNLFQLLFIYTTEKMWSEYMDYIRRKPSTYIIDDSPEEVKELFRDEIVGLYASAVRDFFRCASDRRAYHEGVNLLRNLINYGGEKEAARIAAEQRSRTPRRPALIDELSKL